MELGCRGVEADNYSQGDGNMLKIALRIKLVLAVALLIVAAGAERQGAYAGNTQVFSGNNLGMHCMDSDFSVLCILPPFNVLQAQVIQKAVSPGQVPTFLRPPAAQVYYEAVADPRGSINSWSAALNPPKTNFWRHVFPLFGVNLPLDQGFLGAKMPGPTNIPQPLFAFDPGRNRFSAPGIPITDKDDARKINAYPLMRVTAKDNAGTLLSSLDVVVPVSAEGHCNDCHATGNDAAYVGFRGVTNWSAKTSINIQTRENILILHDAINGTTLMSSRPVLCASCHYSFALDLNKTGPVGEQRLHKFHSRAIHLHHGSQQTDPFTQTTFVPIPDQGIATCYFCHPGRLTKCLRGAMAKAGLICQDCHGGMLSVAGKYPLKTSGRSRRPWIDLPKCQSCHTGDALNHLGNNIILRLAYNPADKAATPRIAPNKRFAENIGKLYNDSMIHGGVACSSCHGSPHAEWPVKNPQANDNLAALQIQGHRGSIIECTVCHGNTLSPTTGGPHGMHNVNDPNWTNSHKLFFEGNASACRSCHGRSLEGTVLSKAAANRVFTVQNITVSIPKGTPVDCNTCHANP
jgi:hypothetical protein